jgi:hypothetical protein
MRPNAPIPLPLLLSVLNVLIAVALFHVSYEQSRPHMEPLPPRAERGSKNDYVITGTLY